MKDLKSLNLNDNMIRRISSLEGVDKLDTLYLKSNRLGQDQAGDVDALIGLLDRPSLTCIDLQSNYLTDPAILEEVLFKMPNLRVAYL